MTGAGPQPRSQGIAPPTDADLVRAALQSQKNAVAELVARHWVTAVGLATRVLGSADLAQDAAQEASITAMLGLDRLRTPERFGAWFCGITLNVARRWLRQLRAELPASSIELISADSGPDERAEAAEAATAVRAAIAGLAPGQRDAVFLFYLQGLTHREVAAELAISVGAVKARLHQARAALRPQLTPLRAGLDPAAADSAAVPGPADREPAAWPPGAPEPGTARPPGDPQLGADPHPGDPEPAAPQPGASEPEADPHPGDPEPAAPQPGAHEPGADPHPGDPEPGTAPQPGAPEPEADPHPGDPEPAAPEMAPGPKENAMNAAAAPAWTDVRVAEIRRSEGEDPARIHVIVLAERDGTRQLPIWIGPAEATALAISLEAQETPRPLTYQMAARLVEAAGSRVTEVKISRLAESVFYAVIAVDGQAGPREIDARPSDAVNLAVVTGVPIRADSALLDLPPTGDHGDWREYPTTAADLAAEARQRMLERLKQADR